MRKVKIGSFVKALITPLLLISMNSQAATISTEESLQVELTFNKHSKSENFELVVDGRCKASSFLGASYCSAINIAKSKSIRISETQFELPPTEIHADKTITTSISLSYGIYLKYPELTAYPRHPDADQDEIKYDYNNLFRVSAKNNEKKNVTKEAKVALSKSVYVTTLPEINFATSGRLLIKGMRPIDINVGGDDRRVAAELYVYPVDKLGNKIKSNLRDQSEDIYLKTIYGNNEMRFYAPGQYIITNQKPAALKYELYHYVNYMKSNKKVHLKTGIIQDLDNIDLSDQLNGSSFIIEDSI
ncbi:MAG: hypothetical protein ACJAT2_003427 [Bacteriovoracaceae bacterium]|jgi:hypothetical protein